MSVWRFDYPAHAAFVAPARAKPQVWRIGMGLVLAAGLFLALNQMVFGTLLGLMDPEAARRLTLARRTEFQAMAITLYGLKTCDTCRKALKALPDAVFVDVREEADLKVKIPEWLAAAGADTLLNTRSTTWRGLSETERAGEPEALLIANPTLIKRPVIEAGGDLHVGWTKQVQAALGV